MLVNAKITWYAENYSIAFTPMKILMLFVGGSVMKHIFSGSYVGAIEKLANCSVIRPRRSNAALENQRTLVAEVKGRRSNGRPLLQLEH